MFSVREILTHTPVKLYINYGAFIALVTQQILLLRGGGYCTKCPEGVRKHAIPHKDKLYTLTDNVETMCLPHNSYIFIFMNIEMQVIVL